MKPTSLGNKGFSLVELMIVIALIGIALSIAVPSFWGYIDDQNLRRATREIASDIFMTRERAISENIQYRIVFNATDHLYSISKRNADETWADALIQRTLSSFGNGIRFDLTEDVIINFQARGTTSNRTVTLINGRNSIGRVVTNMTGRTRVIFQKR